MLLDINIEIMYRRIICSLANLNIKCENTNNTAEGIGFPI